MGYFMPLCKYSPSENIKRRMKQLLIPLFVYVTVITIIAGSYYYITKEYTFREIVDIYLTAILTKGFTSMFGVKVAFKGLWHCVFVSWFLEMLFVGSIIFFLVVDWCLKSLARLISVCTGLILVTMVFGHFDINLPFYICEAPAIAAIMVLGAAFGQKKLLEPGIDKKMIILNSVVSYVLFVVLAVMFRGAGFMTGGRLWNAPASVKIDEWSVPLTVLFSIIGSYPFVHFCRLLTRFKYISEGLAWFGTRSLLILYLHNPVQLLVCTLLGIEPFRISSISEINDFRTLGVYVIVLALCVVIIKVKEGISAWRLRH